MNLELRQDGNQKTFFVNFEKVDYSEGIQAVLKYNHWSREDMAHYLCVSVRTVDGWVNGRKPNNSALLSLSLLLK